MSLGLREIHFNDKIFCKKLENYEEVLMTIESLKNIWAKSYIYYFKFKYKNASYIFGRTSYLGSDNSLKQTKQE